MHANVQRVVDAAAALGLEVSPRTFPDGTRTAQEAADAIGVALGQIVKSLIFGVDGEIVLAYVPFGQIAARCDLHHARLALGLGPFPFHVAAHP